MVNVRNRYWLFIVLAIMACRWDKPEPIPSDTVSCLPEVVTLSKDLQPLFNYNCVGTYCHSGSTPPGVVNLDEGSSYAAMINGGYINVSQPKQSLLYVRMINTSDPMPPDGTLDKCKTDLILKWIKQGAPNN